MINAFEQIQQEDEEEYGGEEDGAWEEIGMMAIRVKVGGEDDGD